MRRAGVRRRTFLKSAAGFGAAFAAAGVLPARSYARVNGANDRLHIAAIGVGGRGATNLQLLAGEQDPEFSDTSRVTGTQIVALCDVDLRREGPRAPTAAAMFAQFDEAAKYHDYRRLLEEMDDEIDAVAVSTPNHHHAPASVMAMRMGKHVHCEKPGAHSVVEARMMAKVAAEQGVATQLNTQVHASENFRRVVELVRAGAIGTVRECHLWNRGGRGPGDRPAASPAVPDDLNWDLWLGPAPRRPFHPSYIPTAWHGWWDFGGGTLGNMGCHFFDLPFWALDLDHPTSVEAESPSPPHAESTPGRLHLRYAFPARGDREAVTLTWTHGSDPPPVFAEHSLPDWAWGVFVGDEGMLLASYPRHQLWPEEQFEGYERPEPSVPPSIGHQQEWVNACKEEGEALCHFGYSSRVTEAVLLGNVAYRSGRKIEWDAERMRIPNARAAEGYLQRGYRPGWDL